MTLDRGILPPARVSLDTHSHPQDPMTLEGRKSWRSPPGLKVIFLIPIASFPGVDISGEKMGKMEVCDLPAMLVSMSNK